MNKTLLSWIYKPKIIFGIYIFISFFLALCRYFGGRDSYNNYLIFKYVFYNTIEQKNLYLTYPQLFFDSNHYGIFFSLIIAPFAILPDYLGLPLWNVANTLLLLFAFNKLPISDKKKSLLCWLCLQEFIIATVSMQFNVALTGLLILSSLVLYQKKEVRSVLYILIGFFVKIYGIVGLSAFFFVQNKKKFIFSFVIIFLVLLVLPMLISSHGFVWQSYQDWLHSLIEKNQQNLILGNRQDYSLMGIVRRVLGKSDIPNLYFLVPGMILFVLPYMRVSQFKHRAFQLMVLVSTLLFLVLFSSGSESPTYIIAVSGVLIWYFIQREPNYLIHAMLIFVIILTSFSFSDIVPRYLKEEYIIKYSLKALPCVVV